MSEEIKMILKSKELEIPNIKTEKEFEKEFKLNEVDILNMIIHKDEDFNEKEFIFRNIKKEESYNYDEKKEIEVFNGVIEGELEYKDMFFDFSYYLESDNPNMREAELVENSEEFNINMEKTINNIENIKKMKELNIPNIKTEEDLSKFLKIDDLNLLERLNFEEEDKIVLPNNLKIKNRNIEKTMFNAPFENETKYEDYSITIKHNELEFEFKYRKNKSGYIENKSFNMLKEKSIKNIEEINEQKIKDKKRNRKINR